ncbi:MAG: pilus assembly protein [Geminicoccaceae bacterium]|nr:pilus assembly protein [Geminicoccaceae bacterium]MCX8100359.1 pilus assembly protein [Geminicoccaceae bacterium]MDW8368850.1 pilus assembly protein [Geminicoccaceae bacterium]
MDLARAMPRRPDRGPAAQAGRNERLAGRATPSPLPLDGGAAAATATRRCGFWPAEEGSTAVDFAIVGPALVMMLIGILEVSALMITQSLLQSAVTEAARTGITGQGRDGLSREQAIRRAAERLGGSLLRVERVRLETLVYPSFDSVGRPEPFTDVNGNGRRDPGEPFTDVNANGRWDDDMGRPSLGGPNDVVLYRVRYEWEPMTPLVRGVLPGGRLTLRSSYAVRNEPFPGS